MSLLKTYRNSADIGSHETFPKIGDLNASNRQFRVTFTSPDSDAFIIYHDKKYSFSEGTILGLNAIVKTNNSRVEITTSDGQIFRLGRESEFCLEHTIEGICSVYHGNVFLSLPNPVMKVNGAPNTKYRTSCYFLGEQLFIKKLNDDSDLYCTLEQSGEVYEYDENGERFSIVHLEPFTQCIVKYDENLPMRNRYKTRFTLNSTIDLIKNIYSEYVLPFQWKKRFL